MLEWASEHPKKWHNIGKLPEFREAAELLEKRGVIEIWPETKQFAYLLGVREIDIIKMTVSAITPDGIRYTESKTKKPAWHPWTPTLRELVREILEARHARMTHQYVNKYRKPRELPVHDRAFTNRFGKPLTMWGITSCMRRLETDGWSFRSLRPKAQNDGGDKNVIGHTGQMREVYTKERKLVPVR